MKHLVASLLIFVLSGCYPFEEQRQPIAKALEGIDSLKPVKVRYCPCDGSDDALPLPTELWPEIRSRLLALAPEPEAEPGPWELKGRLIVTFSDKSELYIDFNSWPQRLGRRVVVTAYWIPAKAQYEFGKGKDFFTWYLATTKAAQQRNQEHTATPSLPRSSAQPPDAVANQTSAPKPPRPRVSGTVGRRNSDRAEGLSWVS